MKVFLHVLRINTFSPPNSLPDNPELVSSPFSVTPSLKHDLLDKEDKSEDDDDDELGLTRGYHQVRLC